jgi:hypothetical protein
MGQEYEQRKGEELFHNRFNVLMNNAAKIAIILKQKRPPEGSLLFVVETPLLRLKTMI